jgi:hypothetical protein
MRPEGCPSALRRIPCTIGSRCKHTIHAMGARDSRSETATAGPQPLHRLSVMHAGIETIRVAAERADRRLFARVRGRFRLLSVTASLSASALGYQGSWLLSDHRDMAMSRVRPATFALSAVGAYVPLHGSYA